MAIATLPGVVAGGSTICTRSPVGKDAERSGEVASIRCCVEFATSFAKRTHQSKSANGSDRRMPTVARLDERLERGIDADFGHVRAREQRAQRPQRQGERGRSSVLSGATARSS